jgi:amt: ammonium transporter
VNWPTDWTLYGCCLQPCWYSSCSRALHWSKPVSPE